MFTEYSAVLFYIQPFFVNFLEFRDVVAIEHLFWRHRHNNTSLQQQPALSYEHEVAVHSFCSMIQVIKWGLRRSLRLVRFDATGMEVFVNSPDLFAVFQDTVYGLLNVTPTAAAVVIVVFLPHQFLFIHFVRFLRLVHTGQHREGLPIKHEIFIVQSGLVRMHHSRYTFRLLHIVKSEFMHSLSVNLKQC